ncbi:recombinase family protein [Crossiella sp. CA198]|uniref:recombinase family protein n=1 Tax=Crossiella sp. CA198 TaxID=3455607 RepID=UPI003F8D1D19
MSSIPIVATVEDLHVSGGLEPEKRDGLKEWLSELPLSPWKTLVVPKLDRLVRSVLDALFLRTATPA